MQELMKYRAGDIVFTAGDGFVSRAIRRLTQSRGESRTEVNHVGILVEGADRLKDAVIVEALRTVKRHKVGENYKPGKGSLAVFRPISLSGEDLSVVLKVAESYVGRKYGTAKIALHALDWLLGSKYIVRKLAILDDNPICSYLVARAFQFIGKTFGVTAKAASPDDIWDFCLFETEHYRQVRELKPLEES